MVSLQQSIGNRAVGRLVQAKLRVGRPGDRFEREADRVAYEVMRAPEPNACTDATNVPVATSAATSHRGQMSLLQRKCSCGEMPKVSGECAECREERKEILQRRAAGSAEPEAVPSIVHEVLRSPGQPLDPATRGFMEPRFGRNFGRVRVHTDARGAQSARAVHASAYTVGNHIVFGKGRPASGTTNGLLTLAHELAHVIQQEHSGPLPPPLSRAISEQAPGGAASAFVAGRGSVRADGSSAPWLARQPLTGSTFPTVDKPRSLTEGVLKDEKSLSDAALMREIKLIRDWLNVYPSAPESNHLRSELELLEGEELMRAERREAEGQRQNEPKEGSVAKLASIVHRGRLEAKHPFWPTHRHLTKGTMEWRLEPPQTHGNTTSRRIQLKFTPNLPFRSKQITFLQTKREIRDNDPSAMAEMDIRAGEYRPFYGMDWDPKMKKWVPEVIAPPAGYKNQPSSSTDPAAYLWDEPVTFPGLTKLFESVAVIPETGETLGALRWGVGKGKGAKDVECTDETQAYFGVALERFYATPKELGPGAEAKAIYNVILDGFSANNATLTADQERQLDPILTSAKAETKQCVEVGGFGDAMDKDPMGISEQRARAVASYLLRKGALREQITMTGFGATWARYAASTKEAQGGRNRRVQIRLRWADRYWEKDRPTVCDTYQPFE
jgi:outer membrane protein OmpA-like peptidoglycan-associated protein